MAQRMQNSVLSMAMARSREINCRAHVTKSSPQPRLRHWLTDIIRELQNRTEPTQSNDLSHNPHSVWFCFYCCLYRVATIGGGRIQGLSKNFQLFLRCFTMPESLCHRTKTTSSTNVALLTELHSRYWKISKQKKLSNPAIRWVKSQVYSAGMGSQ